MGGGEDIQRGTKERGARRSGGAKLRRTVLETCCLRLKIGPVVTGMVMRSQHSCDMDEGEVVGGRGRAMGKSLEVGPLRSAAMTTTTDPAQTRS